MVVDRAHFPRPKPCGEFVNPGAVAALSRLGLLHVVDELDPARIGAWTARAEQGNWARGEFGPGTFGLGIARTEMDAALVAAARDAGARVAQGISVLDAQRAQSGEWEVAALDEDGRPTTLRGRYLVGAGGLRSRLARQLGAVRRGRTPPKLSLTCHLEGSGPDPTTGHLFLGDRLTIGLACTSGNRTRWNATVVVDPNRSGRAVSEEPLRFFYDRLRELPVEWQDGPSVVAGPWASGPFDWPSARIAGPGHMFVGDASGYYDPLTGQGICRALRTVELAAPLVLDVLERPDLGEKVATAYQRRVRRDRSGGRRVQHLIEATVRRKWTRRVAFQRLGSGTNRMTPLIRVTGDIDRASSLARPAAWLPLLTHGGTRAHG